MKINFRDLSRYFLIVAGVVLFIGIFVNATVFSKSQLGPDQNRTEYYSLGERAYSTSQPTGVFCSGASFTNYFAMENGNFSYAHGANCTGDGTLVRYRFEVQSSSVEDQNDFTTVTSLFPWNSGIFTGRLEPVTPSVISELPALQGFQYYALVNRNLNDTLPPSSMIRVREVFSSSEGFPLFSRNTLAWAINDRKNACYTP